MWFPVPSQVRARERDSLIDAIKELVPCRRVDLYGLVMREWGDARAADVEAAVKDLIRDGVLVSDGEELTMESGT